MKRDKEKEQACKNVGITLVHIPYWWDGKLESLKATIYHHRPDLFPHEIPRGLRIPDQHRRALQ